IYIPSLVVLLQLQECHLESRNGPARLPRVLVVEERIRRGEDAAAACESPMTPDAPPSADVSRGVLCCLVYVVPGVHRHAGVPAAAREGRGGVRVPLPRRCRHHPLDTKAFKYILVVMDRHRQGLVDDGNWGLV
ncbi:hypothetical protein BDA96_10G087300, partial [Sorghum bicolor]